MFWSCFLLLVIFIYSPPYLNALCDPMDDEGYVHVPQGPGMGYQINWDYIEDHR